MLDDVSQGTSEGGATQRDELDRAIETGDWSQVETQAAMIDDVSSTSGSSLAGSTDTGMFASEDEAFVPSHVPRSDDVVPETVSQSIPISANSSSQGDVGVPVVAAAALGVGTFVTGVAARASNDDEKSDTQESTSSKAKKQQGGILKRMGFKKKSSTGEDSSIASESNHGSESDVVHSNATVPSDITQRESEGAIMAPILPRMLDDVSQGTSEGGATQRDELDRAIETGDWSQVETQAAMIDDVSSTSGSSLAGSTDTGMYASDDETSIPRHVPRTPISCDVGPGRGANDVSPFADPLMRSAPVVNVAMSTAAGAGTFAAVVAGRERDEQSDTQESTTTKAKKPQGSILKRMGFKKKNSTGDVLSIASESNHGSDSDVVNSNSTIPNGNTSLESELRMLAPILPRMLDAENSDPSDELNRAIETGNWDQVAAQAAQIDDISSTSGNSITGSTDIGILASEDAASAREHVFDSYGVSPDTKSLGVPISADSSPQADLGVPVVGAVFLGAGTFATVAGVTAVASYNNDNEKSDTEEIATTKSKGSMLQRMRFKKKSSPFEDSSKASHSNNVSEAVDNFSNGIAEEENRQLEEMEHYDGMVLPRMPDDLSSQGTNEGTRALRDELDRAIETGDWTAVAEHAANIGDMSSTSGSSMAGSSIAGSSIGEDTYSGLSAYRTVTGESGTSAYHTIGEESGISEYHTIGTDSGTSAYRSVTSRAESVSYGHEERISHSKRKSSGGFSLSSEEDERVKNLERLIEIDDWDGIVKTASKYKLDDMSLSESVSLMSGVSSGVLGSARDSGNAQSEVNDALAQAKMWESIAREASSNVSGESNNGANMAAEWAISRNLDRLTSHGKLSSSKAVEDDEKMHEEV